MLAIEEWGRQRCSPPSARNKTKQGQSSLSFSLSSFSSLSFQFLSENDISLLSLSYDFFLSSENDETESSSRINVWTLNDSNYSLFGSTVFDSHSLIFWIDQLQKSKSDHPNLTYSLFVIGCKADLINVNDGENLVQARKLQGTLRSICLKGQHIEQYLYVSLTSQPMPL